MREALLKFCLDDPWFNTFWIQRLKDVDQAFIDWWIEFYGSPDEYPEVEEEHMEYCVRLAFALAGHLKPKTI